MKISPFLQSFASIFGLCAILFTTGCENTRTNVLASAYARNDYQRLALGESAPEPEYYIALKGSYQGGDIRDTSLEQYSVHDIYGLMDSALRQQNYFPAERLSQAELLIIFHWGRTITETTDAVYLGLTPEEDEFGNTVDEFGTEVVTNREENFRRLGIRNFDKISYIDPLYNKLLRATEEDQYYVTLIAFRIEDLRAQRIQPVWSTVLSAPTRSANFDDVVISMSRVAGNYFGRDIDMPESQRTDLGAPVFGEIGEIKVVGTDEDTFDSGSDRFDSGENDISSGSGPSSPGTAPNPASGGESPAIETE